MEIIFISAFIIYFAEHFIYLIGLQKNLRPPLKSISEFPSVSVIAAAKNEELCIARCIESLLKLDYPHEKLEIIVVNDRSSDRTGEIMKSFAEKNPIIKYIEIKEASGRLKGKTNALSVSVKEAKGEIIFTTDADIEVKPSWINEIIKYYDENTGLVNSYSIIHPDGISNGIQAFDWIYLLTIASGSDGFSKPISCVGNNMSYRKTAYEEVGGYENIKFSITEDFMLLQTIRKKTKWKTKFPVNIKCVNYTLPCRTFRELYNQKKRWAKGGLDAPFTGLLAGAVAWLGGAVTLFGWLAGIEIYLMLLAGKIVTDLFFTLPVIIKFKEYKTLLYMPLFEIYFAVYVFLMPFILLFDSKVIWKEQKL
jgi:cellulose synthase/poly-beta-1,6-N-acetylglucosamine synthase-like glycosyltransferase